MGVLDICRCQECQSKPNNLKETKYCSRIEWKDGRRARQELCNLVFCREACLNAVDSEGRPCCWRRATSLDGHVNLTRLRGRLAQPSRPL